MWEHRARRRRAFHSIATGALPGIIAPCSCHQKSSPASSSFLTAQSGYPNLGREAKEGGATRGGRILGNVENHAGSFPSRPCAPPALSLLRTHKPCARPCTMRFAPSCGHPLARVLHARAPPARHCQRARPGPARPGRGVMAAGLKLSMIPAAGSTSEHRDKHTADEDTQV
jgi:hypothetical protein